MLLNQPWLFMRMITDSSPAHQSTFQVASFSSYCQGSKGDKLSAFNEDRFSSQCLFLTCKLFLNIQYFKTDAVPEEHNKKIPSHPLMDSLNHAVGIRGGSGPTRASYVIGQSRNHTTPNEDFFLRESLRHIYERTYWQRMWVLQEFGLANDVVVCCAKEMVPWNSFFLLEEGFEPPEDDRHSGGGRALQPCNYAFVISKKSSRDVTTPACGEI
jgi:hypothetical protein